LPTMHKILSEIALPTLTPYAEKIIGCLQYGIQHNRSSTDHTFCIKHFRKKWEYNEAVHQLFVDFKEAYYSVRRKELYNILIEFGITMKLVRLIKKCLIEYYSSVQVGKHLSDMYSIKNGLI